MATRCPGCMKLKNNSPVCEHCGYNENVPNYPHQLPVGTLLQDRYLVGKVLGQGGFGITYMGWDQTLMIPVAIKEYYPNSFVSRECSLTLNVSCAGDEAAVLFAHNRERFLREAQILAKLSNVPGIVRINNLFSENNTAYIVMEYVEGIDLKRYIRMQNRVLTVGETFSILRPVMYALSRVHEAELVHRDLSPDNIMILPDGTAKLLDFGAAREVENADVYADLPQSTEAILKHGFAPMEQYRRRGSLGPWTDVYALCATLYYCLTGRLPNSAPERIMGDDNVNWRQIPGLSQQQAEILEKGMALMPENRIRTIKELWNGLFEQRETTASQAPRQTSHPQPEKNEPVETITISKKASDYPTHTIPLEAEKTEPVKKEPPSQPAPKQRIPKQIVTETKPRPKKKPVGLIVAAVLAVIAAAALFLGNKGQEELPAVQQPEPTVTVSEAAVTYKMRKLGSDDTSDDPFWGQTIYPKSAITQITFHNSKKNVPSDAWDISSDRDKSIMAWVEDSKHLHVAANGNIAPSNDASFLFSAFQNLTSIDFGNCFDTSNVTNMFHMFNGCTNLTNLDLTGFDTSNVTDMRYLFNRCSNLKNLDLSAFDTSSVTEMGGMFSYCSSLTDLDLSGFDTSHVTDTQNMFFGCTKLKNLNVSGFDTSNVTNMRYMFSNCSSLTSLDLSCFDTSSVTDMNSMFSSCSNLTDLDLSGFDSSKVTSLVHLFSGCTNLKNLICNDSQILKKFTNF